MLHKPALNSVLALSPSFARQEITDPGDWSIIKAHQMSTLVPTTAGGRHLIQLGNNTAECITGQRQVQFHPPSIIAVTYLSNGRTLNTTLWLSHPFMRPPLNASAGLSPPFKEIPGYLISYGIAVDVHSVYKISPGADYVLRVIRDAVNKTWSKTVQEFSPAGVRKSLDQKDNYTVFSSKGQSYVDLSLDLAALNYPDQYDLIFFAYDYFIKDGHMCRMADITNRVYVPPPQIVISTLPTSLILRPGEDKTVELQVKSNTSSKSEVYLSANQINDEIKLGFTPDRITVPPYGEVTSLVHIMASQNAKAHPYTLPIFANISIPTEFKFRRSSSTGEILYNSKAESIAKNSDLTVTMLPGLTIQEQFSNIWNAWGPPITGIYTLIVGVAAGISPWILSRVRKNRRKNKKYYKEQNEGWD